MAPASQDRFLAELLLRGIYENDEAAKHSRVVRILKGILGAEGGRA